MPAAFWQSLPLFIQKRWRWAAKTTIIFAATLIPISLIPGIMPYQAAGWVAILGVGTILIDAYAQHVENTLSGARSSGVLRGRAVLIRAIFTVIVLELLGYAVYDLSYHRVLVAHPEWGPKAIPFKAWVLGLLGLKAFFAALFASVAIIVHIALRLNPRSHRWLHKKHPF